jgi:hypothetical protein
MRMRAVNPEEGTPDSVAERFRRHWQHPSRRIAEPVIGAHSRDPLAKLLMRSQTLLVRSATSRVSNREATGTMGMIRAN